MGAFDMGGLSADDLTSLVEDLDIEDLEIEVDGDEVTISGTAADQSTRKKAIKALENAEGVSSVKDELEIEDEDDSNGGKKIDGRTGSYTVKSGDTLWGISEKHFGDGSRYMEIFNANKPLWKAYAYDPNVLYPGWELTLP